VWLSLSNDAAGGRVTILCKNYSIPESRATAKPMKNPPAKASRRVFSLW
jgi:hypothetical protein